MAKIPFIFFIVVTSAFVLLNQSGAAFASEKSTEDENGSLVRQVLTAEQALRHGREAKFETSSGHLQCTRCGGECSDWHECCGYCVCLIDTCLYLPMLKALAIEV